MAQNIYNQTAKLQVNSCWTV